MTAPVGGAALDTLFQTMRAFYRKEAPAAPGGAAVELDGLSAFVAPGAPTQSILNCVIYDELAALEEALGELAAVYRDAGVTHWMVWTRPGDEEGPRLLKAAGHLLEYEPMAMALELDALRAPGDGPPFRLDRDPHPVEITTLNERANGELPGTFGTAFTGLREPGFHRYVAELDGRPAACLVTFDDGDNCMVQWVATDPVAQRRRLAGRLLHAALLDARERGMRTSTLESSYEGQRLYEGLGYAPLGRLGMWLCGDPPPELS
ncbi:GNAT family N-acetyltransferase [Conexibacter arvalis]|uniref:GNAT superfamily N-acetyltransferase n=1 Tax=Conexibacter arvalis TaxID=912552 RepID=A0A840IG51_9ACTN|nr:GNAT family N-acetyltransferase [Conexibacter arvalis]MBB4663221.1 GNAT superfamily N-acetyltransferase [Conexibacter arvalis]